MIRAIFSPGVRGRVRLAWLTARHFLRHPIAGAQWLWHVAWLAYWSTLQVRQRAVWGRPDESTVDRVHRHARGLWRAGRSL
jgi:hypothetical protein